MKKLSCTLLFAILLGAFNIASASDVKLSKEFDICMDNAGGVNPSMIDCMNVELVKQDALLNKNYKAALKATAQERRKKLIEAQRAWLKYRDLNCDFYYDPDGGTNARLSATDCQLSETAKRADELAFFGQKL